MFLGNRSVKLTILAIVLISAVLFSLFTVFIHVRYLKIPYLEGDQLRRHLAVLQGNAPDPWQYRVLSDYAAEGIIQLFTRLAIPHSVAAAFIFFRFIQGVGIFLFCYFYYRKLGLSTAHSLIGMSILAWGITHANYDSDLQFSTYFDIIFYLLAGLAILGNKPLWIIPIALFAALNRENSGLIPFMLFASYLPVGWGKLRFSERTRPPTKIILIAAISLTLYAVIFFSLRFILGPRPVLFPYGHSGLDLLRYNLFRWITWVQLFGTLGIIPILAMMSFRQWPPQLRAFFWVIVPIWFLVLMFLTAAAESRGFLVPQALVFIPGALFLLAHSKEAAEAC